MLVVCFILLFTRSQLSPLFPLSFCHCLCLVLISYNLFIYLFMFLLFLVLFMGLGMVSKSPCKMEKAEENHKCVPDSRWVIEKNYNTHALTHTFTPSKMVENLSKIHIHGNADGHFIYIKTHLKKYAFRIHTFWYRIPIAHRQTQM